MKNGLWGLNITSSHEANIHRYATAALFFFIPFLMFLWMLPFVSKLTLGNDYAAFAIHHQLELMFSIKTGSFPLYVPGISGWQTSAALTQGQIFHPISHLSSWLPGYCTGKALEWNTLFRLISLGLAQLLLFHFLRKLKVDLLWAFVFSFITVYNLRMLDLFRYGASLESWTGYLFLCSAIGFDYLKPTRWRGPVFIIGATYWLICSGHPQMMYYGLLGAGLFTLIIPFFTRRMPVDHKAGLQPIYRFWFRIAIFGTLGLLLSSAYVLPFYFDFIGNNAGRVAQDYAWANAYRDTFVGTMNNFFNPLRSDVHGVFGGSSLILVAVLVPVLWLFRIRIPSVVIVIWIFVFVAFLHVQGSKTPVHFFTWKYLPFASSFRIAGRISMIIPLLCMLALAWIIRAHSHRFKFLGKKMQLYPSTILAITALVCFAIYGMLPSAVTSNSTMFSAVAIREIQPWVEPACFILGAAVLGLLAMYRHVERTQFLVKFLLCLIACIQVMLLLQHGTWIAPRQDTPTLSQMIAEKQENLSYRLSIGSGLATSAIINQVKYSYLEPFLGKIYSSYQCAASNPMAYTLMAADRPPGEVVIEECELESPFKIGSHGSKNIPDRLELKYSAFNRLIFEASTSRSGFLGLAYPYTGHWEAFVNDGSTHLYRANGAYHALQIPAGKSRIEFRYWSASAFWGMIISCTTFALLGMIFSFRALKRPASVWVAISFLALAIFGSTLWYHSLYNGDNLKTDFTWESVEPPPQSNLAFGKQTRMSSLLWSQYPFHRSSGKAVDGDVRPLSGFVTSKEMHPWWMVDLHRPRSFNRIVIYETRKDLKLNNRPLKVMISDDRNTWHTIRLLEDNAPINPHILNFKKVKKARYIAIQASGMCQLSLDEVEIYPLAEADSF
ncbi:MAG: discoidin domain-containing protein [Deltaproteobacteria bacterium]|nr:discoidin domain-containing protein [Deltaproteobacteria bacterium]